MTSKQLYKLMCQEVDDDAPTKREVDRAGLKKHLGKKVQYVCTFEANHGEKNSAFVRDVKLKGKNKVLCHHLWLNSHYPFSENDEITFTGLATNYNDRNGVRKYRLAVIGKVEKI